VAVDKKGGGLFVAEGDEMNNNKSHLEVGY